MAKPPVTLAALEAEAATAKAEYAETRRALLAGPRPEDDLSVEETVEETAEHFRLSDAFYAACDKHNSVSGKLRRLRKKLGLKRVWG